MKSTVLLVCSGGFCCTLVRPVAVMVPGIFGQYRTEMPLTEDQYVIQALAAKRAGEPLSK